MIQGLLGHPDRKIALLDEVSGEITYGELKEGIGTVSRVLREMPSGSVSLSLLPNGVGCVLFYLGALAAGQPHILVDPNSAAAGTLVDTYQPAIIAASDKTALPGNYRLWKSFERYGFYLYVLDGQEASSKAHASLALMLTTSGSTGNPKLVRLSLGSLTANASSIVEYLGITADEVAVQSLPFHYSYGLSILNSHLQAGATVAIPQQSFMRPEFWAFVSKVGGTSFAGVPYMYETLHRLRIDPFACEGLRVATQAGGGLRPELIRAFHEASIRANKRLFVMYGQTEATARISYVPVDRLALKIGSIGVPIPRGALSLRDDQESGEKELIYSGPNVMLGYAESPAELQLGDVQGGVLATGDLGRVDADGFFWITGRMARFAKLFGKRVHLGDIEAEVEKFAGCTAAAIENPNSIKVFIEDGSHLAEPAKGIKGLLARKLGIPPAAIQVVEIDEIPRTSAGKKSYRSLVA